MIIQAKDFVTRQDLETHVRNKIGLTPELKTEYEINGTRSELARLQLSDRSLFWGVRCVVTDGATTPKTEARPDRGPVHKGGINKGEDINK